MLASCVLHPSEARARARQERKRRMEQSPFRNPRLIRRFTILSFSRPMGNEPGIPSPRGGKKTGGKKGEKKGARHRGDMEREREKEGGRKGENRAHVRSPQAERVKGRDANGKTSVENVGGRVRELGKGGRGTRLEDRQTRGGVPLRSAPRRARLLSDNANQLSHFNVLFPLFQAARGCCQ